MPKEEVVPKKGRKKRKQSNSEILEQFIQYSKEIDTVNDTAEKIYKLSRKITTASKRIIFAVHRLSNEDLDAVIVTEEDEDEDEIVDPKDVGGRLKKDIDQKFELVKQDYKKMFGIMNTGIARNQQKRRFWEFHRKFNFSIHEYFEALSFYHYLCHQYVPSRRLIRINDISQSHNMFNGIIDPEDFLLGVYDLTGELMRFAVNLSCEENAAAKNKDRVYDVCLFLQQLLYALHGVRRGAGSRKDRNKHKQCRKVLKASVRKVENACYSLRLQLSETKFSSESKK